LRAYLIVALLLLGIFGGLSAYLYGQFNMLANLDFTPPPATVAVSEARTQQWSDRLKAIGTVKAVRGVELSTEESGEVTAIDVRSGDRVQQGQLLVTLNDRVEQASRESQLASLELAQILFDRDDKLIRKKSIPQSQLDRSKADLERAIAQLAETEARLYNKRIHAPFAGTVGIVHVRVGDYVQPGTAITSLQDLTELEIDFTVPARHYPHLRQGLNITVQADAFPEQVFGATLQSIDAKVDANTRNLLLRASLDPGSKLLPGMFAELTIDLNNARPLVTVPETAITYAMQGDTVFVVNEEAEGLTVQPRLVRPGDSRDGRVAILEGLAAGERVVSAGQNKLYRGASIIIDDSVALRGL
tara:strand:+ start:265058 stop:266134 length:1077 start_codon:yes stop_codon:yes gene_type:complete